MESYPIKESAAALTRIIQSYGDKLKDLPEETISKPAAPGKWSKKEELGHLVDSAHTNLRRFVVGQYETEPQIVYDQEFWVRALGYQQQPSYDIISLWIHLNEQIVFVLNNMSPGNAARICNTGKKEPELRTLRWLAADYNKHLLHHLHHILELDEVPY